MKESKYLERNVIVTLLMYGLSMPSYEHSKAFNKYFWLVNYAITFCI